MTIRVLASVLIMFTVSMLTALVRRNPRWYAVQVAQLSVAFALACIALGLESALFLWLTFAVLVVTVLIPRMIQSLGRRWRLQEHWLDAASAESAAGWMMGGNLGKFHRALAPPLRAVGRHDLPMAESMLERLAAGDLSVAARDSVRLLWLAILLQRRQWQRAIALHESTQTWGSLAAATKARLRVARAYAELGDLERGMRCLEFVALSPIGAVLDHEYWPTRLRLAAMAGECDEVERLLASGAIPRRGFTRVAAYWRGRCALARGERDEAMKLLTRAYALTPPGDRFWREAIQYYIARTDQLTVNAPRSPAQAAVWSPAIVSLRRAERTAAPWRALVQPGKPGPAAATLLGAVACVFLVQLILPTRLVDELLRHAANTAQTTSGEWWRAFTALFLHADLLHFAMNAVALWTFGSTVERSIGGWRMLVVFFLAGATANIASANLSQYQLSIGASAGLFGLVGAYAVALYRVRHPIYAALRRRLMMFLALIVAGDFLFGAIEPQIDNVAHVGGFVAGIVLSFIIIRVTPDAGGRGLPPSTA